MRAFTLLAVLMSFSAAAAQMDVGVYRGRSDAQNDPLVMNITRHGDQTMAELLIDGKQCSGFAALRVEPDGDNFIGVQDRICSFALVKRKSSIPAFDVIEVGSCVAMHGVGCSFDGYVVKASVVPLEIGALERKQGENVREFVNKVVNSTKIETVPKGAAVIVGSEYIGRGPVDVDLKKYLENVGVIVKALPPKDGCVAVEYVQKFKPIPKHILLDTRLCPIVPPVPQGQN